MYNWIGGATWRAVGWQAETHKGSRLRQYPIVHTADRPADYPLSSTQNIYTLEELSNSPQLILRDWLLTNIYFHPVYCLNCKMSWYPPRSIEETRSFQTYGNELTSTTYPSSGPSPVGTAYLSNPSASIPTLPRHANVIMAPSDQSGYGDGQQFEYPYGNTATRSGHPYYLEPGSYHQRMLGDPSVATETLSVEYPYSVDPTADQRSPYGLSSRVPNTRPEDPRDDRTLTVDSHEISAETMQDEHRTEALAAPASTCDANIYRVKRKDEQDFPHGELKVKVPHVDVSTWRDVAAVTGRALGTISKGGREDETWNIQIIGNTNYLVYWLVDICLHVSLSL
jgi:hypothetical protein